MAAKIETIPQYFAQFTGVHLDALEQLKQAIRNAVPGAEELISYQLPAFKADGAMLVYYSAYKDHVSISFPPPFNVFEAFKTQLAPYEVTKTAVKFPLDQPLPTGLISDLVKYKAEENAAKAAKKKRK